MTLTYFDLIREERIARKLARQNISPLTKPKTEESKGKILVTFQGWLLIFEESK
jgi:hypothetical protein